MKQHVSAGTLTVAPETDIGGLGFYMTFDVTWTTGRLSTSTSGCPENLRAPPSTAFDRRRPARVKAAFTSTAATASGLSPAAFWLSAFAPNAADITGDHRADLVVFGNSGLYVRRPPGRVSAPSNSGSETSGTRRANGESPRLPF